MLPHSKAGVPTVWPIPQCNATRSPPRTMPVFIPEPATASFLCFWPSSAFTWKHMLELGLAYTQEVGYVQRVSLSQIPCTAPHQQSWVWPTVGKSLVLLLLISLHFSNASVFPHCYAGEFAFFNIESDVIAGTLQQKVSSAFNSHLT